MYDKLIVVLGAGGPAGINFVRSVCAAQSTRHIDRWLIDSNPLHLALVPRFDVPGTHVFREARDAWPEISWSMLRASLRFCTQALVHAQPDVLVAQLAAWRDGPDALTGVTYLPGRRTVAMCQDKLETAGIWYDAGLLQARPVVVAFRGDLTAAEREVGYPMWIRARRGAGARHASWADGRDVAGTWINYLTHRYGAEDLVVQPYLPGRDFAVTFLYWHGVLEGVLMRERLEYLYPQHAVSGRTGTPVAVALIRDDAVRQAAERAVQAVADAAQEELHGVYCVDLRGDADGVPRPTEINAGRFFTTSHVGIGVGVNLVERYVQRHFGARDGALLELSPDYDGTLVLRHMDANTVWVPPWSQTPAMREAVARLRDQTMTSAVRACA